MKPRPVLPNRYGPDEADFRARMVAGLARAQVNTSSHDVARAMGRTTRQLSSIMGGALPGPHALFGALLADPTALDEILAAYGYRLETLDTQPTDDLALASGLNDVTGDLIRSRGKRSPRDTLKLADKPRPIIAEEEAIVREADHLRGLN